MLDIVGHAITSADGMIADGAGRMPAGLRSEADWRRFQAALDGAVLVVVGRLGHEAHPNPGRRRLVVTSRVDGIAPDPDDRRTSLWNPATFDFGSVLDRLRIADGVIAVTGGTRVFDLFLPLFTRFDLVTVPGLSIPGGRPCFASGLPGPVLAGAGLLPGPPEMLEPGVSLTAWHRPAA